VAVEPDLRVGAQFGDQRADPLADVLQDQGTGRVDHVDALAPRVGHDPGLLGQHRRWSAVRHRRLRGGLHGRLDQLLFGGTAEPIVERGSAEAVAVGDLDHRQPRGVQRADDGADVRGGELVLLGVRAVAQ